MHKIRALPGHRAQYRRLCALALPVALLVAAPRLALAAPHELCLRWRVDAIDRTTGTLAETRALQWPARGARVRVSHTNGMIITTGRTNASDACFTFQVFGLPGDPTPPTVYRNVRVYYDTRGGTPSQGETDGRVQVRGFFTQPEDNNNTDVSILIQNVGFQFHFDGTYRATVDVGSGVAPMSISMASVSHTLNRVDTALIANKPAAPPLLKVILQNCQYSPTSNWSCMDVNAGKLWLTPDAQNGSTGRKFVSGHEAGHWLDYHWGTTGTFASTGGGTSNYQFSAGSQQALAQTCRFTWSGNGGQGIYAHAMRSQEYQHAAVREAFAHFMALFSFNVASSSSTSNPQFLYYKTQSPGLVDGDYPANDIYYGTSSLTSSGIATPHSFLDSLQGCNCTVLGNCDGTSTQMQWMRAYWWYLFRDEPGGPKPSLTEFFGQIQASSKTNSGVSYHTSVDRCYGAVVGAIPPAYSARWQNVGTIMGLASDEP